jgi:hypothetical protein
MSERRIDRRTVLKAATALAATRLAACSPLLAQSGSGGRESGTGRSAEVLPNRGEFVIRGAHVLTIYAGMGDFARGDIHVRDGAIVAVAEEINAPAASSIDARGMICMPGFIDTHWHHIFGSSVSTLPQVKEGKLRLLAVTTPKRTPALPNVPTIAEAGLPGYEFTGWMGFFAPVKTPRATVERLHAESVKILRQPEISRRLQAEAAEPVGSSPAEFAVFLKDEIARWTKVAREAQIKVD